MKSSISSTTPSAYPVQSSGRSHRAEFVPKSKTPHESRDTGERLMKKFPRASDEGKQNSRRSRAHSPSISSLFSQQNLTLEDIPISAPSPTPAITKMSTSRPVPTSRSTNSTPQPPSQFPVRAVSQKLVPQQPKVEDNIESVTQVPTLAKAPSQKPVGTLKQNARPLTPEFSTGPAPTPAPASTQRKVPSKPDMAPAELNTEENGAVNPPPRSPSTKLSTSEIKPRPRRSLDDSQLRQTIITPANVATATSASVVSPPQSPRLHAYNTYNYQPGYMAAAPPSDSQRSSPTSRPPQGMPPMNYGYMPLMTGGPPSMYANPYYGMPFSPPVEPLMQNNDGPRPSTQDEHQQLLEKVAGVLPDINRLLNNYKETHCQLSAKEMLAKKADLSHSEQLDKVKVELEATKKEYEKVIQNLVGERSKLEREVTSVRQRLLHLDKVEAERKALQSEMEALRVNKKELTEGLDAMRRSKEEMQFIKLASEKEIGTLKKGLQVEKELHHRNLVDVKEQAKDQMDLKQKEFYKTIGDHKLSYSTLQMELTSLLSKHTNQKKELDAARASEADYKVKVEIKSKQLEDALARHGQEIQSIKKKHEEEQERKAREGEELVAKLSRVHSAKETEWQQGLHDIGAELKSEKAETQRLRKKLQDLKNSKDSEKLRMSAELVESLTLWRTKSDELQKENQKMDRILQGFGCATEIKSKGDEFFLEAFYQLAEQIVTVSRECFLVLPSTPAKEIMVLILGEIPEFMDTTPAASEIRACYVQSTISRILLVRIFQPFLFTLGRRYGGVGTFLQSLSNNIRRKSERREAAWRQTTLRAAYTVSKAREAINVVAIVVVDEIVDEIKHFAHQSQWPAITFGVQRIVKSAAEVWRLARIERELIKAFMPDIGTFDTPECDWPEPDFNAIIDQEVVAERDNSKARKALMCLLPQIVREPIHESFLDEAERFADGDCVYLHGKVLYADSSIILTRRRELTRAREADVGVLVDETSTGAEMNGYR